MDIVDIIKQDGRFGVVEGKEAVLAKIKELAKLEEIMEEMAGKDKAEYGKRQPGEIGTYEKRLRESQESFGEG